jgi:vacuolar-type H+-ATPase subunit I/STV1
MSRICLGRAINHGIHSLHQGYHTCRFALEVLIVVGVIQLFFHKLLGFVAGYVINQQLSTKAGAFHFEFGYIQLSIGLEYTEVIVNNFVW